MQIMKSNIGIIFDLDGTLLNTLDDLVDSVNFSLSKYSYPLRTDKEIRSFVGNGVIMLMKRSCPTDINELDFAQCFKTFEEFYFKNMQNKTRPYPGIIETLEKLNDENILIAIVSNKFQDGVDELTRKFFKKYVKVAVGTRSDLLPKPSPESVYYAIGKMDLNEFQDEIYYVGDSEVDILTAHNANLPIIAVTWGFRDREDLYEADYIVDEPQEILNIVFKK